MKKLAMLILLLAGTVGLARAQEAVNQRRPVSPDARVSVNNIAGKVIVSGWSRDEVEITGTLGKGTEGLEVTGDRDRLDIKVKYPEDSRHRDVGESDLEIHVPRGSRLSVHTVSASIDLSEFEGEAELNSVSGPVTVGGSPGVIDLSTVSGRVKVATKGPIPGGEFHSVSGDIEMETELQRGGRYKLNTVSGGVILRIPSGASAEFRLSSFSGGIDTDFGQKAARSNPNLPSSELNFTLGGGDARVTVSTLSGRIEIRQS